MRTLTQDEVLKALGDFGSAEGIFFDTLLRDLEREYPAIVAYLGEIEEEVINTSERNLLLSAILMGYHIIRSSGENGQPVDRELLDRQLRWNLEVICLMDGEDEDEEMDPLYDFYAGLNDQPEIMFYIVSFIYGAPGQGIIDREDNLHVLALHAKTIMDCMLMERHDHLDDDEDTP